MITGAVEQWVSRGLHGTLVGALEIAAAYYSRAFAVATVTPQTTTTAALTPEVLGTIARRMVASGEYVGLIDVDGGRVSLTETASHNAHGGRLPWRYQVTYVGPDTTDTRWVPGDRVVHCKYATLRGQPWIGVSPLTLAGTTGRLARELERALADESSGPVGSVIPLPRDAGEPDQQPGENDGEQQPEPPDPLAKLRQQIARLAGRCGLVETTAAGWDDSRSAAPKGDWEPRRIGPNPPQSLVDLRAAVEETVFSVCGVPPGLARAEGGESRESFRRFYSASLLPLAAIVQSELRDKLDVPDLRLTFDKLAAADVHGRARAFRSLVGTEYKMDPAEARRLVGLDG